MKLLHLGCGRKGKAFREPNEVEVISLDADARLNPDIVCCLGRDLIPLPDDSIDTAVAIHVLEHIGKQGETAEWFQFWEELYRVLKPEGKIQFESPMWNSVWAWGDPSHTRALSQESFFFFSQDNYRIEGNIISPFRIRCDFVPEGYQGLSDVADGSVKSFRGVLTAKKPLYPWWEDA
jgi:SAM-dependent methyltransferase